MSKPQTEKVLTNDLYSGVLNISNTGTVVASPSWTTSAATYYVASDTVTSPDNLIINP